MIDLIEGDREGSEGVTGSLACVSSWDHSERGKSGGRTNYRMLYTQQVSNSSGCHSGKTPKDGFHETTAVRLEQPCWFESVFLKMA